MNNACLRSLAFRKPMLQGLAWIWLFLMGAFVPVLVNAQSITTGTLVQEMTDLEQLTRFPNPAYKTVQFSSYDRRSDTPGGPEWYANSDGFGGEPIPNVEAVLEEADENGTGTYLLCDVEGPGAMIRTWTANINGQVRVYLDNAEEPIYEGPARRFFQGRYFSEERLSKADLDAELYEHAFLQRDAGYFPIPFAERFRVEWTGNLDDVHFYELEVRTYPSGTNVETFSPDDLQRYQSDIQEAMAVLANPRDAFEPASSQTARTITDTIPAGERAELFRFDNGPRALTQLTLKVEAEALPRVLRQAVLHITFDDHPWAQVQAPVGDFFGAAPGINPFDSLPLTVGPDSSMTSRFVMPFAESASAVVENRGDEPITITGSVQPSEYTWDEDRSMHFYARWRVDHKISPTPPLDLPFLLARGQGVYVGSTSMLNNSSPIPTSGGNWWGEGDEKIFVDGEEQPSFFGTGSEDYYNYAWASPNIFYDAYSGQPRNDGPGNRGFVSNFRWHVLDPLPFQQHLSFYMELFHHEPRTDVSYARTAYYYGRPGLTDDHTRITDEDVRPPALKRWTPAARKGAQNAIFYQAEELVGDHPRTTKRQGNNLWAGGTLLVWRPAERGETLPFSLPVPEDGRYTLHLTLRQDRSSGQLSASLGDRDGVLSFKSRSRLTEEGHMDLFRPHREMLRTYRTDPLELDAGEHPLLLRYEGPGREGGGGEKSIGIDFVWIQKQ